MKRRDLIVIIEAALATAHWPYAEAAARALLEGWPHDLEALYGLARALAPTQPVCAIEVLHRLTSTDPQDADAQALLGRLLDEQGRTDEARQAWDAVSLMRPDEAAQTPADWLARGIRTRRALQAGDAESAFSMLQPLPAGAPASLWFLLLETAWHAGRWEALRSFATRARSQWPQAVLPALVLGASWGRQERGMLLLHDAAALDPAGRVAARLWGTDHPHRHIWPPPPWVELPGPLPAEVMARLGWNQLPAGPTPPPAAKTHRADVPPPEPQTADPDVTALNAALLSLASHASGLPRPAPKPDNLVAVHLIVSHRSQLEAHYGAEAAARIDALLERLVRTTEKHTHILTDLIYVDRQDMLAEYGLSPPEETTPAAVTALLAELDAKLNAEGAAIGSVLLVGGDAIVPFHRLPNPVEDGDGDICTDAPYASRDAQLLGERAVGRLPQPTAEGLERAIMYTLKTHKKARPRRLSLWRAFLRWLMRSAPRMAPSLGYTASVWRRAAGAVYKVLDGEGDLHASPPMTADDWHPGGLQPARYGYFNLHGLQDVPHWYGQRDAATEPAYPDFPVALSPDDVVNGGRAPRVVFTEACYGAHVQGKSTDEALALRFMACGTTGFVGATCIAYGSVSTPLTGADLLAQRFWERLLAGRSQGQALRDAKIAFAREMHRRQGYLDTEDQKTLLSFVLYGDPTLHPAGAKSAPKNKRIRSGAVKLPHVHLAGPPAPAAADTVPHAVVQRVKGLMAPFLPGIYDAEVDLAVPSAAARTQTKGQRKGPSPGMILVIRKRHAARGAPAWQQTARVTLTEAGKVMKVVITRGGPAG